MSVMELTVRDQLIIRILHMPDDRIAALAEFVDELEEDIDPALIEARKHEPAITLDDYLKKHNLSREELEAEARAEGLMK